MKKLSIFLLSVLFIYSIYYDLQSGTLPISNVATASANLVKTETIKEGKGSSFIEVTVKPGDTVLSLIEQHEKGNLPVSIPTIIQDFQVLNKGIPPEKIQIGKTYKLPLY